jgi:hypothetical protein
MSSLASLNLVQAIRPSTFDPISHRRMKFTSKIMDQIELAKAAINGTIYLKSNTRFEKDIETDERISIDIQKRISPWWWIDKDGRYLLAIKYGTKRIEFSKGKSAIQCQSLEQIISSLETLKQATLNGELDSHLQQAGESIRKRFKHPK